jgi:hypothetical protein
MEARSDADFKATSGMVVKDYGAVWVTQLGDPQMQKVVLSGDSVLFHYGPRVQELADNGRLKSDVFFVTGPSCPPVPEVVQRDKFERCGELVGILADLIRREGVKTVVLGASWNGYGGKMVERNGEVFSISQPEGTDAFYANLQDYVTRLQALGAKVYLVLPAPHHRRFDPAEMVTRNIFGFHIAPDVNSPVETSALRAADGDAISKLREVSKLTGATLLDPFPDVCGAEYCSPFFDDGKPKFSDGMHLRPVFVRKQIQIFDNLLMVQ